MNFMNVKKIISTVCASAMLFTITANAARIDQANELNSLVSEAESLGYSVEYEKAAAAVFERFSNVEEKDAANSDRTTAQREYNSQSMDRIFNETKSSLESFINGEKEGFGPIVFPAAGERTIKGNSFVDANGNPFQSVGFGHFTSVFDDADMLKTAGSNNIQTEIGPSTLARETSVPMWKVLKNNGCDADINVVEEADGNHVMRVTNRVNASEKPNTYVLISQYVPVKPNTNYLMSFDAVSSSDVNVIILPDSWNKREYVKIGTSKQTYNIGSRFKTGAEQRYTCFMIVVENAVTVDFDNIVFKEMTTGTNILENSDMEDEGIYYFEIDSLINKLNNLKAVKEKGFSVDLLISPHYMPTFIENAYPEMAMDNGFLQYNINYPAAEKFIYDYVRFITPIIAAYDCVDSICLSNEPNYKSALKADFYNPLFRQWLQKKHGTIENLNAAHGSSYKSFDAISIPNGNTDAQPKASALSYEYTLFNEEVFANWHKMMADIIKPYGIPVHSKMQDYLFTFDDYSIRKLRAGTDAELFAEFCDIAGNDACIYNSSYGEGSQISTMMWYDFLASVTDKPVYNSEDHVIEDDNTDFSDKQAQNVRYSLLSGAVHGRSGSTLWTWQEDYSATGLFADVPYSMYLTSRTMLDMARLNNELNALRTAENDVAVFYSKASRQMTISKWNSLNSTYEEALKDCYSAVTPLGVKTGFVTERHPEKVNKYKAVILPEVRHIPETAVKAVADYMRAGGKAVIYGSNTLGYTEYGISKSTDDRQYIKDNAIYVSSQTVNNYATALGTAGLDVVSVKDSSGSVVTGVDVKATEYKGDNLIFITNLNNSNKTVYLDDTTKMINLLTGDESEGELTLVPYEPVILSPVKEEEPGETVVLGENSVEFDVSYTPEASENIEMIVIVKDESGAVIGASYQTLEKVKGITCEFSGSIDCKNADSLNVVVFDSDTDAIIYRNTIN